MNHPRSAFGPPAARQSRLRGGLVAAGSAVVGAVAAAWETEGNRLHDAQPAIERRMAESGTVAVVRASGGPLQLRMFSQ